MNHDAHVYAWIDYQFWRGAKEVEALGLPPYCPPVPMSEYERFALGVVA